jgi:hypothetical protein
MLETMGTTTLMEFLFMSLTDKLERSNMSAVMQAVWTKIEPTIKRTISWAFALDFLEQRTEMQKRFLKKWD